MSNLDDIRARHNAAYGPMDAEEPRDRDISWLLAEVDRLMSQPTMLVDLGGDVTPEFERSVRTFWEQAQIAERSRIATLVRALPASYFDVGTSGNRVMVELLERAVVMAAIGDER